MDNRLFAAVKPTTLSRGTALGGTILYPSVIQDREGNTLSTMATYFGTKGYGVISPGKDREEHFTFTGISGGTLTGVSHITMTAPYTETSGVNEAHAAGETIVILSNTPGFYNDFVNKQNDETVAGTWTFDADAMPRADAQVTYGAGTEEYLATKRYVDGVALVSSPDGSTTQKGVFEEATQAEIAAATAAGATAARLAVNPSTLAPHIQSGAWLSGSTAGTADAITATLTPTLTALSHNMVIVLHITTANNAGCTLNVDGLGAKAVYKYAGGTAVAVEANDMKALYHHVFVYDTDAAVWLLVNPVNGDLTAVNRALVESSLPTLTGGATSNADSLHTHTSIARGYLATFSYPTPDRAGAVAGCGYSVEAGVEFITIGGYTAAAGGGQMYSMYKVASDYGREIYPVSNSIDNTNATIANVLYADGAFWSAQLGGNTTAYKAGTSVTFGSNACAGAMSWDDGNSYLMFLNTTTNVRRFTYSGTNLTFVDNITLDNAVTIDRGWVFDDTNNMMYFLSSGGISKFNMSGVRQSVTAITVDTSLARGLVAIGGRIHIAFAEGYGASSATASSDISTVSVRFVPTTITF